MLKPSFFYRNARSGELLELFLVSAVSSLLLVRFFLHLTHYPSVGGASLHIAHMLYGGVLMTAALVLLLGFVGQRVRRLAAVVGGVGFGLFIDELGKFITRDNNYFFQPTVALIYIVFALLFVVFRSLARDRHLTQTEYLLNALLMTEEVVIDDLDAAERRYALRFLAHSDPDHPLVPPLRRMLMAAPATVPSTTLWGRWRRRIERRYEQLIASRFGVTAIDLIFVAKAVLFLVLVASQVVELREHEIVYHLVLSSALQFASSAVSAGLIVAGVLRIRQSRLVAYDLFIKALLVDIFITQFFAFYQNQFNALPGFVFNVVLYVMLRFLLRQERRLVLRQESDKDKAA